MQVAVLDLSNVQTRTKRYPEFMYLLCNYRKCIQNFWLSLYLWTADMHMHSWWTIQKWMNTSFQNGIWQPANFKCHLPTLPNYDINIYDKAVIIKEPTTIQVTHPLTDCHKISSFFAGFPNLNCATKPYQYLNSDG